MGAKNNDSTSEKQAIVKFYTMEYRKCGNSNSKNDSRLWVGASTFLKSVYFRAFAVNVKTIAPKKYLYQSGHAIWWYSCPMAIYSFIDQHDLTGKQIYLFCSHGTGGLANSVKDITDALPNGAAVSDNVFHVYQNDTPSARGDVSDWLKELGY